MTYGQMRSIVLPLLCSAVVLVVCWRAAVHYVPFYYVDQTKESGFLKGYSPKQVVDSFPRPWPVPSSGMSGSEESSGGWGNVTNQRLLLPTWVRSRPKQISTTVAITNALRNDLKAKLLLSGATLLQETDVNQDGFRIAYELPHIVGWVAVTPVSPARNTQRHPPLPQEFEDMTTIIKLSETWFRTDADLKRAKCKPYPANNDQISRY